MNTLLKSYGIEILDTNSLNTPAAVANPIQTAIQNSGVNITNLANQLKEAGISILS